MSYRVLRGGGQQEGPGGQGAPRVRGGGAGAAAGRWPGSADLVRRGPWPRRPRLLPTPGPQGRAPAWPRSRMRQVVRVKLCGNLQHYRSGLRSSAVPRDEGTVNDRVGLPLLTLTWPSRKARCRFVVKPVLSAVVPSSKRKIKVSNCRHLHSRWQ